MIRYTETSPTSLHPASRVVHRKDAKPLTPEQIRFEIDRCIGCGSCVPVCPVDNHRELLMLSLKQRLGPSWNGPINAVQVQAMLPVGWNIGLNGKAMPMTTVERGEFLGDVGQQHTATAHAQSMVLVISTPKKTMQHLLEISPGVRNIFEQVSNGRLLETSLKPIV